MTEKIIVEINRESGPDSTNLQAFDLDDYRGAIGDLMIDLRHALLEYYPDLKNYYPRLNSTRGKVVEFVREHGPVSSLEVADGIGKPRAYVARTLMFLAQKGLLEKKRAPSRARGPITYINLYSIRRKNDNQEKTVDF